MSEEKQIYQVEVFLSDKYKKFLTYDINPFAVEEEFITHITVNEEIITFSRSKIDYIVAKPYQPKESKKENEEKI